MKKSPEFEKIYRDYLAQVAGIDFGSIADKLGVQIDRNEIIIPFFGRPYRISARDVIDPSGNRPSHAISVALCKYLILCPETNPVEDDWVSYRDFKDAVPFSGAFANHTEKAIARNFSNRIDELEKACMKLGGRYPDIDLSYDLIKIFDALPKVPVLMLFNDEDDEFPAQCSVLFEKRAEKYLDMECLAIVGWLLSDYLNLADGGSGASLM